MRNGGANAVSSKSPEDVKTYIDAETAKWAKVIERRLRRRRGIRKRRAKCACGAARFSLTRLGRPELAHRVPREPCRGVGAMKALLATCIAGAILFTGMMISAGMVIHRLGGNAPGAAVPDAMPVAMPDLAASSAPAVAGRFPMPGFPDDRVALAEPSHQDAAPDARAEKAAAPALAAAMPGPSVAPNTAAEPGPVSPAASAPVL